MKKKSYWLSISVFVLILIWTGYYYAMQYTGGFADLKDSIVCGIVGLICCLLYTSPMCAGERKLPANGNAAGVDI